VSAAVVQFLDAAGKAKVTDRPPKITFEGQSTFIKLCTVCNAHMPHVRRDDFSECVICGTRTYAKRNDSSEAG
jgi:rRNA maturation endonuclease Nob1